MSDPERAPLPGASAAAPASRRAFLHASLGAGGAACLGIGARSAHGAPALVTPDAARPSVEWGTQAGDVSGDRAIVWCRTDRPARLVVEWSTTDSFTDARRVTGPAALPETGFTARVDLSDLPRGQHIVYRARFQDLDDLRIWSLPVTGSFRTPPAGRGAVSVAFSADTVGQGWGIDRARGGMLLYETMRREQPDLFLHCGDVVYADQPLQAEVRLDDGSLWRNLVTPAKSKVAETQEEFRGNYLYNLLDDNLRRFNAEVGQLVIWDDHETRDNWYPTERLEDDARYAVKSVALLAARAKRAFLEHVPLRPPAADPERIYRSLDWGPTLEVFGLDLRSERGANSANRQATLAPESAILGMAQLEWLKAALAASRATWKVIACDMPIGLVVPDGRSDFEAIANRDDGPPLGRELEIASLLAWLRERRVRNVVWVTGDVHYCAAHRYDPERARFRDFDPFWELVAGPAHAGTYGPNPLDLTFGPEVRFVGIPEGMKPGRPPSDGFQFFGTLRVDPASEVLTARLHDLAGRTLFEEELEPER